ncbi:MAG: 3-oxoacyl-[acyl-carrier-protein] reductase [Acidobacteriaceae bacterium]|nr:3-oxoacyl-[acyl-carrier-protein] reductase [Acidobacteriaceae bacterium]MBV9765572.1 3-oxoacyl-[acyl-carrier-protein] reductase [Acidobacteriaceae bacterium]
MSKRTALVTGASRGIGKACAQTLASAGHRVILAARSVERLEETASLIRDAGGEAFVTAIDLASHGSIASNVSTAAKEFGRIDILVNNAGITKDGLAVRMKPEDWRSVLETNLSGSFFAIQQVLPGMMRERWGRIVNISSVVGEMGNAGQANYAASKAGLIGLTKSLAREIGSRNITVNAVSPGFIETDMTRDMSADLRQKMIDQTPLKRMGTPEDVAAAVRFLASDEASFITGHVLEVNGGIYM